MGHVRPAKPGDAVRIAEILVFSYRLNFYPIFRDDSFYFRDLNVPDGAEVFSSPEKLASIYVYDDGTVKGFAQVRGNELLRLFVEPVLCSRGIGSELLRYVLDEGEVNHLWALEKNTRAINFYKRHGFTVTNEKKYENDTDEYLVKLVL